MDKPVLSSFYAVYVMRTYNEDWEIGGVFSLERDAEEFLSSVNSNEFVYSEATRILEIPMECIIDRILKDRLGVLSKSLLLLEAKVSGGENG